MFIDILVNPVKRFCKICCPHAIYCHKKSINGHDNYSFHGQVRIIESKGSSQIIAKNTWPIKDDEWQLFHYDI